jgi:hypothetical protein
MDELLQEYGEYSQFIVMVLVFLVGAAVYGGYVYYQKQEDMKRINSVMANNSKPQSNAEGTQPVQDEQHILTFIPSEEFKGERKGYKYGKGPKGLGYYLDN